MGAAWPPWGWSGCWWQSGPCGELACASPPRLWPPSLGSWCLCLCCTFRWLSPSFVKMNALSAPGGVLSALISSFLSSSGITSSRTPRMSSSRTRFLSGFGKESISDACSARLSYVVLGRSQVTSDGTCLPMFRLNLSPIDHVRVLAHTSVSSAARLVAASLLSSRPTVACAPPPPTLASPMAQPLSYESLVGVARHGALPFL